MLPLFPRVPRKMYLSRKNGSATEAMLTWAMLPDNVDNIWSWVLVSCIALRRESSVSACHSNAGECND